MPDNFWGLAGVVLAAYLLGSVPTGYLFGRARGLDIRTVGSGNLGATNVLRVLGIWAGLLVLLADVAKGFLAVFLLPRLTPYPASDFLRVACGLAAVLGHTYSAFLGFKGGKGVATTFGVLLVLAPISTVLVFLALAAVVAATRYVSAGSLTAAVLFPLFVWLIGESGQSDSILVLVLFLSLFMIYFHRANLRRLFEGRENRLGQSVTPGPKDP